MASGRGDRWNRGAVADLLLTAVLPRAVAATAGQGRRWLGSPRLFEFPFGLFAIRSARKRHGRTKGANKNVVVEATAPGRICAGIQTAAILRADARKSLILMIFVCSNPDLIEMIPVVKFVSDLTLRIRRLTYRKLSKSNSLCALIPVAASQ